MLSELDDVSLVRGLRKVNRDYQVIDEILLFKVPNKAVISGLLSEGLDAEEARAGLANYIFSTLVEGENS